jgi:hypothetical protein
MDFLFTVPISEEQMKKGQELLDNIEAGRQEKLLQYAEKKLLGSV